MSADSTHPSKGLYLAVFVALLLLTGLTVAVAYIDLGGLNNVAALSIAGAKAALVIIFFMHLRESSGLVKSCLAAGGLWLAILFAITLSDYWTRTW